MFGYIKTDKPEMRVKDFEAYKAVYCSLCKELGRSFGIWARFTLNYDFTFLAVLRMSLNSDCPRFKKMSCTFNPFLKCNRCLGGAEDLTFAANAAMIMTFYKVCDNIRDDGFFKRIPMLLLYPFAAGAHKKAVKKFPELEKIIGDYITAQKDVEQSRTAVLDRAAQPTAAALAELFSYGADQKETLYRLGYCMGRWIYFIDALDDIEEDIKTGGYNPFIASAQSNEFTEERLQQLSDRARGVLNLSAGEAAVALQKLKTCKFRDILENIVYLGLPQVQNQVIQKRGGKV